jgi:hypothetical protein
LTQAEYGMVIRKHNVKMWTVLSYCKFGTAGVLWWSPVLKTMVFWNMTQCNSVLFYQTTWRYIPENTQSWTPIAVNSKRPRAVQKSEILIINYWQTANTFIPLKF